MTPSAPDSLRRRGRAVPGRLARTGRAPRPGGHRAPGRVGLGPARSSGDAASTGRIARPPCSPRLSRAVLRRMPVRPAALGLRSAGPRRHRRRPRAAHLVDANAVGGLLTHAARHERAGGDRARPLPARAPARLPGVAARLGRFRTVLPQRGRRGLGGRTCSSPPTKHGGRRGAPCSSVCSGTSPTRAGRRSSCPGSGRARATSRP